MYSGTTALTCLMLGKKLYLSNLGDCRALLVQKTENGYEGKILTKDHKPTDEEEKKRIEAAGGRVCPRPGGKGGSERVWLANLDVPGLSVTRAFGDHLCSDIGVISDPTTINYTLTDKDYILLLASDGIWEFMNSDLIVEILMEHKDSTSSAKGIMEEAVALWGQESEGTQDDITCAVIYLQPRD